MKSFSALLFTLLILGNTVMAQTPGTLTVVQSSSSKQTDPGKVLYILNGKVTTKAAINALDAGVIDNIDVYKNLDRVVIVSTEDHTNNQKYNFKWNADSVRSVISAAYKGNVIRIVSDTARTIKGTMSYTRLPIYVVEKKDGSTVVIPNLQEISPRMIRSINFIKDEETIRKILKTANNARKNQVAEGGIIYILLR